MVSLAGLPFPVTSSLPRFNSSNCLVGLSNTLSKQIWAVWDLIVRANLTAPQHELSNTYTTIEVQEVAVTPPTVVSRPQYLAIPIERAVSSDELEIAQAILEFQAAPSNTRNLKLDAHALSATFDEDLLDDLLIPSPPPSPTLSDDSQFSSSPSPIFDHTPTFLTPAELEQEEEIVEPVRSLAYPVKRAILRDWLLRSDVALKTLTVHTFDSALAHGVAFIESEEPLELRYDADRGRAKMASERLVFDGESMKLVKLQLREMTEEECQREARWARRIEVRMEQYVGHPEASPVTLHRPMIQGLSTSKRNRFSLSAARSSESSSATFFDLPSLRRDLSLPVPVIATFKRTADDLTDCHEDDRLHMSLVRHRCQEQNLNVWCGKRSTVRAAWNGGLTVEEDIVVDVEMEDGTAFSSSSSDRWCDDDGEGDDDYFLTLPVFSPSSSPSSSDADDNYSSSSLYGVAAFAQSVEELSVFSPAESAAPILSVYLPSSSALKTTSITPRWSDIMDADEDDDEFFSTPPVFEQ